MEYSVPDEPFLSLGDAVTPNDSNVPVGRLADAYNRDVPKAFLKPVHRNEDRIAEGYAVSSDILDKLSLHRAHRVFILERDTELVLEFSSEEFKHQLDDSDYYVAKESEAKYRWPDVGLDCFSNNTIWGN